MSVYPFELDDDTTIIRVDDNVTEIAGQNFNQVRDAVFKIELELGIKPAGTKNNLKEFLEVAHNQDGTIKESALSAVGLVTLPIDNADVGINAGIVESKLTLDYSTNTLKLLIEANAEQICNIRNATDLAIARLNKHIGGGPEAELRHVLSHIDVNGIPFDSRDVNFTWDGLKNTEGGLRPATHLGQALEQINDELVEHQLATDPTFGHPASGISIDPSNFSEIPGDVNDVQEAIEALDALEENRIGVHRAIMHSQGVPSDARSSVLTKPDIEEETGTLPDGYLDGYGETVVTLHQATAYLATTGGVAPIDSPLNGDDLIQFATPSTDADKFKLDSEFFLVEPGDIARINYGSGYEAVYIVESKRHIPGTQWVFRINGNNLLDTTDAYVRIDQPNFDKQIWGVAATAVSNAFPTDSFSGFLGSVIVSDPRSAVALGSGFDPNQLDASHYLLYLEMYPNGNPNDKVISIPGIDVTGNQGATPGDYTLESVIQATNNGLRAAGVNARFVAFEYEGNFGITMADAINGAAFAVLTGERNGSNVEEGTLTNNVIGDVISPVQDGLGLGASGSDFASPKFSTDDFADEIIALKPTKVLMPRKRRFYVADGSRRDFLRSAPNTEDDAIIDGYWTGTITDRIPVPGTTVKTEYTIEKDLRSARLFPGKTITVQPLIDFGDALYRDADYGRFILENVQYIECPGDPVKTILTVINGVHADPTSDPEGASTGPAANLQVAIHFDNSSVGFNKDNVVELGGGGQYHRLHEIYATSTSETFSHERLRLPVQVASTPNLGTENWRLRGASPKLRGYTDNNTSIDRYVRFYILSYDSTSGEYDGYIGRRNPSTDEIFDYGPITSGSKNAPVRFYDNTGVDYIELEYLEPSTGATAILAPAYADIQVFPSLQLDDELLLLATCEVNWQSPTTQIVERLIDRRPIGSVSETEFTQSAKDFITAGDRHLHTNGVVLGFESFGEDPSDTSAIILGGGTAIVNGKVVNSNGGKVRIPELVPTGSGSGTDVDWAVCVDEDGNFVTLPLTATKQHYFAEEGTGGGSAYFIPSATFSEIVNERQDLLLLYVVTVTIASVTIGGVFDVRKSAFKESGNITLSLSDKRELGSFTSIVQFVNWAKRISEDRIFVKVRGDVTIDNAISFADVSAKVIIEGDGGVIRVNSSTGIEVKNGFELRNIKVAYNHTISSFDSANIAHLNDGVSSSGCIKLIEGASNITIENCEFLQEVSGERYPYIAGYSPINPTEVGISNVFIEKNIFRESNNSFNCAIGFLQTGTGSGFIVQSLFSNINIVNNVIEGYQSIIFTGENEDAPKVSHVKIHGNSGDTFVIGFSGNERNESTVGPTSEEWNRNVSISENNCSIILPVNPDGKYDDDQSLVSGAEFNIKDNEILFISIVCSGFVRIINNMMRAGNRTVEDDLESGLGFDLTEVPRIGFSGVSSFFKIIGNTIEPRGGTKGIYVEAGSGIISANNFSRSEGSVESFIDAAGATDIVITDNILSHSTNTSGGGTTDIVRHPENAVVFNNIRDVEQVRVPAFIGNYGYYQTPYFLEPAVGHVANPNAAPFGFAASASFDELFWDSGTGGALGVLWMFSPSQLIPRHAKITGFSYNVLWSSTSTNPAVITEAQLRSPLGSSISGTTASTGNVSLTTSGVEETIDLSINSETVGDRFIYIRVYPSVSGGWTATAQIRIKRITMTYTF